MNPPDTELLRRYAEENSEAAFAELVQRRIGLVYAVALRQCGGDASLAEDVTQKVFTDLARKAAALCRHAVLSGWLHRSARFAASDVVRSERRRRGREAEAQTMPNMINDPSTADWEKLRPLLDDAINELPEVDRNAVALRFFEELSFAEIGRVLEVSEEAARKRVDRAVDKLHALLGRRGVSSTAAALAAVLANQPVAALPAGLVASVTGAALAGAAAKTGFMSITLLQAGLAGAVAVTGVVGWVAQARTNGELRAEIAALERGAQEAVLLQAENRRLTREAADLEAQRIDPQDVQRLRGEVRVLQARAAAKAPVAALRSQPIVPLAVPDPETKVQMRLPDADADTALSTIEIFTGRKVVRDPSLGRIRGLVNVVISGPVAKAEAVARLQAALRDGCGVVLEPMADGRLLAKPAHR